MILGDSEGENTPLFNKSLTPEQKQKVSVSSARNLERRHSHSLSQWLASVVGVREHHCMGHLATGLCQFIITLPTVIPT